MSNTKHTPLPWEVQSQGADEPIFIIGPNPEDIIVARVGSHTSTSSHYASDIVQRADAELIVRACNARDELLAAAENALCAYGLAGKDGPENSTASQLRAAIAKVTQKPA